MERFKLMLTGGFLAVLTLYLAIFLAVTTMNELQPVSADVTVSTVEETTQYAQLTDAQPQRDITQQNFASLANAQ